MNEFISHTCGYEDSRIDFAKFVIDGMK